MKKEKGKKICIITKSGFKGVSNTLLRTFFRQTYNCNWLSINSSGNKIIIEVSFVLTEKKVKRFADKLGDSTSVFYEDKMFKFSL